MQRPLSSLLGWPTLAWSGLALVGWTAVSAGPIFEDRFEDQPYKDTGIDWCADNATNFLPCPVAGFPRQDAEFGRDALARQGLLQKKGAGAASFDFTKLDASGSPLPAEAGQWHCVLDNLTNLVWEVKVDQPDHLRHVLHQYSWYDPDPSSNGGGAGQANGGFCVGGACDTEGFVNAVNAQGLCGASDWRLPTLLELSALVHRGAILPAMDTDYFPYIPQQQLRFWTSTTTAADPNQAWRIEINNGFDNVQEKVQVGAIRLVRQAQ